MNWKVKAARAIFRQRGGEVRPQGTAIDAQRTSMSSGWRDSRSAPPSPTSTE